MSEALEQKLNSYLSRLVPLIWGLLVMGFGAGAWATTLELRVRDLQLRHDRAEADSKDLESSVQRIEFYVQQIALKVGVKVEAPR